MNGSFLGSDHFLGIIIGVMITLIFILLLIQPNHAQSTVDKLGEQICKDKGLDYDKQATKNEHYKRVVCSEVIYDTIIYDTVVVER
jgi:uncharacterized membrane protein YgaE (UPF0421/DUF939 family)